MKKKQLTILELKKLLEKLILENPHCTDYLVFTEGCDCSGEAVGVVLDKTHRDAEITRK